MKKIVSLVLILAASSPVCAMQTSSQDAAVKEVFAQVLTDVVEKKTGTSGSIQASSSQIAPEQALPEQAVSTQTSCSQCSPTWQTSFKALAAGMVGAGIGAGAYRLGLIKREKTAVVVGACIGMGAVYPDKLKQGLAMAKKVFLGKEQGSGAFEPQEIELKDVSK